MSKRSRLYIPRGKADWRRLINEQEVVAVLERHGFEIVDFGTLTAIDQIRKVANADAIVSVLGAGSAITAFSPPDCVQIQLSTPKIVGTLGTVAYAAIFGQPYARINGEAVTPEEVAAAGLPPTFGPVLN
jgi:capsular polysaccharide biosynthesis protein